MEKRQIINFINFIRGCEPRCEMDLLTPVKEQIKLLRKYKLKGTFLLQYDALIDNDFTDLLLPLDKGQFEIGVWFEIVQPLCEKAGLPWRGRYPWDWHVHCGFSVGYTPRQREQLIDTLFADFKGKFGYYPKVFGAWAFDAHTLGYVCDTYGLDAACNCKDQWGTDGYTLWGGYYGQGYYPSRQNAFTPAQNAEDQIHVPILRMLGSDPVVQYDLGLDVSAAPDACQGVVTLEPVYTGETGGGGVPEWVDWYLDENFSGNCLTFGYAQAGQENSFGWDGMKNGLTDQVEKVAKLVRDGKLEVETLGETGRWYKENFEVTASSAIVAREDWKSTGRRSVWYNCKNYRANIYAENGRFWIRDIYLFREDYAERYLDDVATGNTLTYENLPFIDGNRHSGNGMRGGLFPAASPDGEGMPYDEMRYTEEGDNAMVIFTGTPCGTVRITLNEQGITLEGEKPLYLLRRYNPDSTLLPEVVAQDGQKLSLRYRDYNYTVSLAQGVFCGDVIAAEENKIQLILND